MMNSVIAALIVFLIRAVFVLYRKRTVPYLWWMVFLSALCPLDLFGNAGNGMIVDLFLGSSFKFYFFLVWEGFAAVLTAVSFYRCRRRKWRALEAPKLSDNAYVLEGLEKAMVCGFFHPVVYLPADLDPKVQLEILERKNRMIADGGQKLRVCAALITYFNWFNPVLWLSRYYLEADMKRL